MRKIIKYVQCYYCGLELHSGDDAVKYGGDFFCDKDCVFAQVEKSIDDTEITDGDCDEEYEDEDEDE